MPRSGTARAGRFRRSLAAEAEEPDHRAEVQQPGEVGADATAATEQAQRHNRLGRAAFGDHQHRQHRQPGSQRGAGDYAAAAQDQRRRWPSSVTSARATIWSTFSTSSGHCTAPTGTSSRLGHVIRRRWTWPARTASAGMRRTRWPGRCALAAGRIAEAEGQLRRALEIFQRIGTAEAADVAAELDALPLLPSGSPAAGCVPLTLTMPTSSPVPGGGDDECYPPDCRPEMPGCWLLPVHRRPRPTPSSPASPAPRRPWHRPGHGPDQGERPALGHARARDRASGIGIGRLRSTGTGHTRSLGVGGRR